MTICKKFDIFDISYNFKYETILGYTFQLFRLDSLTQMPPSRVIAHLLRLHTFRSCRKINMNASLHACMIIAGK